MYSCGGRGMMRGENFLWTDGSCLGNPGVGGWAYVLLRGGERCEASGGVVATTNNRMEMMAAIEGLSVLAEGSEVVVYTDSKYLQLGMTVWLPSWLKRQWRNASGGLVLNVDLWQQLRAVASRHTVDWRWVKGHSNDAMNAYVDRLARDAASVCARQGAASL